MKKKKILSIILIILIILICVSSFIGIQYSKNNSKTDVDGNNENNSEELKNIEGKYSDIKITDAKTALSSLESVKDDINIKNINTDIKEFNSSTSNNIVNTYSFKQYYNGLEVYGNTITIYTDKEGNALGIINKYVPIEKEIQTISKTNDEDIKKIANKKMQELEYENFEINNNSLILFPIDKENYKLAHKLEIQTDLIPIEIIIDDESKEILVENSKIYNVKITNEILTQEDINEYKIADSEKYELVDQERNIKVEYDKNEANYIPFTWNSLEEANNINASIGIKSLKTLQYVYDYFYNELGVKYITGEKETSLIHLVTGAKNQKNKQIKNNAFFIPLPEEKENYIILGENNLYNEDVEVMAHEYTHGIFAYTTLVLSGGEYKTKAINEAYADILGMCAEAYSKQSQRIDGIIDSVDRDIKNSKIEYKNLPKTKEEYEENKRKDNNKEEHYYSQILSRAAYLMSESMTLDEFKNLWYNSMFLLPKGKCNYYDCEYAVLKTAEIMNFTQEKQKEIRRAFEKVGIVDYDLITKDIKDYADKTWNNKNEKSEQQEDDNTPKVTVKLLNVKKYSEGVAWAQGENNQIYLLDETGNIIYETTSSSLYAINDFKDGYAVIIDDNGRRIINKKGQTIIEAKDYDDISYTSGGTALIRIEEDTYQKHTIKYGVMNLNTKQYTFEPQEAGITDLGEGMYRIYPNANEVMLLNGITGKSISKKINEVFTFERILEFHNGYGGAYNIGDDRVDFWDKELNEKSINIKGKVHSSVPIYSEKLFFTGSAFYNLDGDMVIDLSDEEETMSGKGTFKNGHAMLQFYNGSQKFFTVIDKSGRFLFEPKQYITSANVVDTDSFALYDKQEELYGDGYILCRENSRWKVLDVNGRTILQLDWNEEPVDAIGENGTIAIKKGGEYYYKTIDGKKILASKKQ